MAISTPIAFCPRRIAAVRTVPEPHIGSMTVRRFFLPFSGIAFNAISGAMRAGKGWIDLALMAGFLCSLLMD
ncbi:Uncharacterised protein [Mycobacteroides abscessus subsp. abscessus]|nr:Uncharacterised protein [Mycobacteroides abscessus subsp. abscessus]